METKNKYENWYNGLPKKLKVTVYIILAVILACLVFRMGENTGRLLYYLMH